MSGKLQSIIELVVKGLAWFIWIFLWMGVIFLVEEAIIKIGPLLLLVAILLLVFGLAAAATLLSSKNRSPRVRVAGIILGFITIIIGFASFYQMLYLDDPSNFKTEFKDSRNRSDFDEQLRKQKDLYIKKYHLQILYGNPDKILESEEANQFVLIDSTFKVYFHTYASANGPVMLWLETDDGHHKIQFENSAPGNPRMKWLRKLNGSQNEDEVRKVLVDQLESIETQIAAVNRDLINNLKEGGQLKFIDFVFYSGSKVSLGGYDRIKSASRFVYGANICQSLIGVIWLAFGISIFWPKQK